MPVVVRGIRRGLNDPRANPPGCQAGIGQQVPEAFAPDLSLADMVMAVQVGTALADAIVKVQQVQAGKAQQPVDLRQEPGRPLPRTQVITGGKGMAGIKADPGPFFFTGQFEDAGEFFKAARHFGTGARLVLQEQDGLAGYLLQDGFHGCRHPAQGGFPLLFRSAFARVHDKVIRPDLHRPPVILGHCQYRPFVKLLVGSSRVGEVREVDRNRPQARSFKGRAVFFHIPGGERLAGPAPRVTGKDLEGIAPCFFSESNRTGQPFPNGNMCPESHRY